LEDAAAGRLSGKIVEERSWESPARIGTVVQPEQAIALLPHEAVGVVKAVHRFADAPEHADLETRRENAELAEQAVKRLQHAKVGAIDVDLEKVDVGELPLCQDVRRRYRMIREQGIHPLVQFELLLVRDF